MSTSLHVVFGAGQIGAGLARQLKAEGHRVRVVRRSDKPVGEGIEVVQADARDVPQAVAAAAGADVIYHCMNPSAYSKATWEREFPQMGEAIIAATLAAGARLVCLDNLYMYGESAEARTPLTPQRAEGRKGQVRIRWEQRLHRARTENGLQFAVGRAGDFFGPGAGEQSFVGVERLLPLIQGGSVLMVGRPDAPHAFSYVPDVIAGLIELGRAPNVEGEVVHLPVLTVAPRALVSRVADALNVRPKFMTLQPWAVRVLGLFVPFLGELKETLYQWDRPFLVDDSSSRERFGIGSTLEEAVAGAVGALRSSPNCTHASPMANTGTLPRASQTPR